MHHIICRLFAILLMSSVVAIADDSIPADANEPALAEPYQSLRAELLQIHADDQKYRLELEEIRKTKPIDGAARTKKLWEKIAATDAECLKRVKGILAEHSWLGLEQVGKEASVTSFFVIQHTDIATQQEYLPMIRQAVKDKKLQANLLPLLEDRVAIQTGHKQVYGTQIGSSSKMIGYYVSPLEDPDNVDKRRAEVGLEPLAEYVKRWGIIWEVEAYKKQLPELEAIQKTIRYTKDAKNPSFVERAGVPEQNKPLQAELLIIFNDDQQAR